MAQRISGTPGTLGESVDPQELPATAAETTAENPWPLSLLSNKMKTYIDRMSSVWVEGQVVQLNRRGATAYATLRDTDVDMSLSVTLPAVALERLGAPLTEGARVVVWAKPSYWAKRGTLQLEGRAIREIGLGQLLARIEELRRVLAAEGVFDTDRKRPLPFLPRRVGLVCGRGSKAEHDVVENARRRWPAVRFEIRQVAVQGASAVTEVTAALAELDAAEEVDVIVIARGGGSVEDLLPFSNEALVRAVARARTPVVSAIGHHEDTPLLDHVADWRASTPTDAGKRVVPDLAEERARAEAARTRGRRAVTGRLGAKRQRVAALRARPVLADPGSMIAPRRADVARLTERTARAVERSLAVAGRQLYGLQGQVRALSPAATMERGYAVVQHADGRVVRTRDEVTPGELLRVRVADGEVAARAVP